MQQAVENESNYLSSCVQLFNKFNITSLPKELIFIRQLEIIFISRDVYLRKWPKWKSLKMKGCICNVPIDKVNINCNLLHQPADSNGEVIVKLKRKAVCHSHVLFLTVRPSFVNNFLEHLINNNHLYSDIRVNMNNLPLTLRCFETDEDVDADSYYRITALT